jgi:hypothetical protein
LNEDLQVYNHEKMADMRKEKIILINQDEVCFEFSKKSEHYNAMQAIEFNNFG